MVLYWYIVPLISTVTAAPPHQPFPHRPAPAPGTCQWCGHCCGATKQVLPPWPSTYEMKMSTVIMPCNGTGLIDPTSAVAGDFSKWSFASIDWSNGKDGPTGWSKGRPMDAETGMVEQAARLVAANPLQKVGVYRNIVAAQPWFPSVAAKLRDPQYSGWFLPFADGATLAPRCDSPDAPQKPLCSDLFHGTQQVPRWPITVPHASNDGNCSAPGCDCGGVPCGRYLFDHTNASMRAWLINEHILGATGIGNENVSAIYLDDNWQTMPGAESPSPLGGPTEIGYPLFNTTTSPPTLYDGVISDLGFNAAEVQAQTDGWKETMRQVQAAVLKAGGWSWAWFLPAKPAPQSSKKACVAYFDSSTTKSYATGAIQMSMSHTEVTDPVHHTSTYKYTSPVEDLASFLLVRGPYAYLGAGWAGCDCYPNFYSGFERDYGVPKTASFAETSVGSAVFARSWTKAEVSFDCNTGKGVITMKQPE